MEMEEENEYVLKGHLEVHNEHHLKKKMLDDTESFNSQIPVECVCRRISCKSFNKDDGQWNCQCEHEKDINEDSRKKRIPIR